MNDTYRAILAELKDAPQPTAWLVQTLEGDVVEALICLCARGLIRFDPKDRLYHRDEEALDREEEMRR